MTETRSILLVDANQQESRALFTALVRAGHSVTDTHRADFALELLADRSFEVAVVDLLSAGTGKDNLIRKLAEDWSNPLIIGIADFAGLLGQGETVPRGPHHFLGKPVDVQRLVEIVSSDDPPLSTPSGRDILDFLRCVSQTGANAVVGISDASGQTCTLVLAEGKLIHAVCEETRGEDALFRALAFDGGSFLNVPWNEPDSVTIQQPTEILLAQAYDRAVAPDRGRQSP